MRILNIILLSSLGIFISGCWNLNNYGVDPILNEDSVKSILSDVQNELLIEYNESRRHDVPVTDVDLELIKKYWDENRKIVNFDFYQQVTDEFGKRITIFEKRTVIVSLRRDKEKKWALVHQGFK